MIVPTHAGSVVVRGDVERWSCLLVEATGAGAEWVIPKGHIEPGESPAEAAMRELAEEAGVVAEAVAPLGMWTHLLGETTVTVEYFLARYLRDTHRIEERALLWAPFTEAIKATPFPEAKRVIRAAQERVASTELGTDP